MKFYKIYTHAWTSGLQAIFFKWIKGDLYWLVNWNELVDLKHDLKFLMKIEPLLGNISTAIQILISQAEQHAQQDFFRKSQLINLST